MNPETINHETDIQFFINYRVIINHDDAKEAGK